MKKSFMMVVVAASCCVHVVLARGGDSFLGGMAGSMTGSIIGSAMTNKSSGGGYDDRRGAEAQRSVDRLEDKVGNDLRTINKRVMDASESVAQLKNRMKKLERRVIALEKKRGKESRNETVEEHDNNGDSRDEVR